MVLEYAKAGLCTLAVPVLKEVVRTSPSNHPLAIICRQILQVEPSAAESIALAALACAADTFGKAVRRIPLLCDSLSDGTDQIQVNLLEWGPRCRASESISGRLCNV